MNRFGRKLTDALEGHSHGSISARYTKPKESPMHEDEEMVPTKEEEQEQPMEEGDDDPHLDLEGEREM